MNLPLVDQPERYHGLYVYDFGGWSAVGYTADEIAVLQESEAYRGGTIYKIHRATPDGRFELRGVSPERFRMESGMFFYRGALEEARRDFAELRAAAQSAAPPCRAFVHLSDRGVAAGPTRYVTALVYPAEHEDEVGQWLLAVDYRGGDTAEGGISHVSNYYAEEKTVLERQQLGSQPTVASRSPDEVLATVRRAVQR